MIKFNGQKVINVAGKNGLYLSYEPVNAWGHDISVVAHHVLVDMEKQNVNTGRQAQRDGQEGIFLDAHFLFNSDDVVVRRYDTAEGVRKAYLDLLEKSNADYEASPEGIAARKKYDQDISDKTEAAGNLLTHLMRVSHKYKNAGSTFQPVGRMAYELLQDVYAFMRLADDIPNTNWDQDIFLESMERFNYVRNQHVGRPAQDFTPAAIKRAFIIGQAMNWVKECGCFHQTIFVLMERYFKAPDEEVNHEKRNGGEQTDA